MRHFRVGAVLAGLCLAFPAHAEPSDRRVAAEALFAEGQKLMQEGNFEEACRKFEASQRHDRGVGTMLNLADCYERLGRTASAWAEFRAAISAARAANRPDRETLARERTQALEGQLSRLTLSLSPAASALSGVVVRRDGAAVDPAEFGSAIPIDPGKHVIEASAPDHENWVQEIEVEAAGATFELTIPELAPVTRASPSQELVAEATTSPKSGSTQRTLAWVAGGVGVAGIAMGTVFGLRASSKWNDAKSGCADYPYECSAGALAADSAARSAGTLSTVGFILGGVGLATGAVLWFTAGSGPSRTSVGILPQGVIVKGSL